MFAENKLFATVDSTVRKVVLNGIPFLLTDTVGFIRKLPHGLIESFKSTLDEVREADILIHVIDYSHSGHEEQVYVVNQTLAEIGCSDKPTLYVYNKIDLLKKDQDQGYEIGYHPVHAQPFLKENHLFISASKKLQFNKFLDRLESIVANKFYAIFPNYLESNRTNYMS